MKVVSTKLENKEWEALVHKCNEVGCTISEYVRRLILKEIHAEDKECIVKTKSPEEMNLDELLKSLSE